MRARRAGAGGRRALVRRRRRIVAFDTQILDPAFSPSRAARYVAEGAGGRPRVTYLAPHLPHALGAMATLLRPENTDKLATPELQAEIASFLQWLLSAAPEVKAYLPQHLGGTLPDPTATP